MGMTINRRHMLMLSSAGVGAIALGSPRMAWAQDGNTFQYGEAGSFATFNPWTQAITQSSTANQMFSRLVYNDFDGNLVGDLAETWEFDADGKALTLKLREGVKWHDDKPLTGEDFVTMYSYLSDPAFEKDAGVGKVKALFAPVVAVTAPDDLTVRIEFSAPVPYAAALLNYFYAIRFEDAEDTAFLNKGPIGTGPYRFGEHVPGQYASFVRNDSYFGDKAPADGIHFSVFAQGSNLSPNLSAGVVNGILVSNQAEIESLQSDAAYEVLQVPSGAHVLMINAIKAPFDNPLVRRALSYSMNRAAFAEAAHFGIEKPTASPFYAPSSIAYSESLVNAHPFDLAKARQLLDEAGIADLRISYPAPSSNPNYGTYGEIWQADLSTIGVRLDIERVDVARWRDLAAGKVPELDVVPSVVGRSMLDPSIFFSANAVFRAKKHRFGYENPAYEELLNQAATEIDPDKRKALFAQIGQVLVDEAWIITMLTDTKIFVFDRQFEGQQSDRGGNIAFGKVARAH
jgi:peptide/nickel transport system substrate-binding protein